MTESTDKGLDDLERELSCSICTDILYQPLTLLNCLHTFCGSCLLEWFKWQASKATSHPPYTCPSCRSSVLETRPNATVTTLLELLLKARPDKAKSQDERDKIALAYKPGDIVTKPLHFYAPSDSDDERLMDDVRELSLHDDEVAGGHHHQRSHAHHRSSTASQDPDTSRSQPRRHVSLGHQSSLRSIMSASDIDDADMQEEIMRQIVEEGFLDDIDLDRLTPAQEEEITERIARAVRRRQRRRRRTLQSGHHASSRSRHNSPSPRRQDGHPHSEHGHHNAQPAQRGLSQQRSSHLQVHDTDQRHRARSANHDSHQRRRSASNHGRRGGSDGTTVDASRSATDLTAYGSSHGQQVRQSARNAGSLPPSNLQPTNTSATSRQRSPAAAVPEPLHVRTPRLYSVQNIPEGTAGHTRHISSGFTIPKVACSRCQTQEIQTQVHYNCSSCSGGTFNVCAQCYRTGRGCLHWFGFGYAAVARFEQSKMSTSSGRPHVLSARRYRVSNANGLEHGQQSQGTIMAQGLFCEGCHALANSCYWHCDICNDGAWGYCMTCVRSGQHCTHPLQAMARKDSVTKPIRQGGFHISTDQQMPVSLMTDNDTLTADIIHKPILISGRHKKLPHVPDPDAYEPLLLPCTCATCHLPIPSTTARHHCPTCNNGDYDICTTCYTSFCSSGRIKSPDGLSGLRLCLSGHRTTTYAFLPRDSDSALQRTILQPPAGGWAPPSSVPTGTKWRWPDSAVYLNAQTGTLDTPLASAGVCVVAVWSHWPSARDELSFPRGAEISDVQDINGDWCWGWYAGRGGLFPGGYVRPITTQSRG